MLFTFPNLETDMSVTSTRALGGLATVLSLVALGCGTASPTPTAAPTPTASAKATSSPASSAPSGSALKVTEFGFSMTLPAGVADATYTVDKSGAGEQTDVVGAKFTYAGTVYLSTTAMDAACAGVSTYSSVAAIGVYSTDPTQLQIASGPDKYTKVGQYWYGFSRSQSYCTPAATDATETDITLFHQAFDTITSIN